jgi:hypothetical protein
VSFSDLSWLHPDRAHGAPDPEVQFGDHFRLVGYDLDQDQIEQGDVVRSRLYWEVLRKTDHNYTVFTHIWDEDKGFSGQQDQEPLHGSYPTSWLGAGEIIVDEYDMPVRGDALPGIYSLLVGWYDWQTGERLPVERVSGTSVVKMDSALALTDIDIRVKDE